jgi:uncharacterized protein (TIGR00255 family)
MDIQSMTGYGRGAAGSFSVEARSSNQRYLDIRINAPSYLSSYEMNMRKMVKEQFQRGRIDIYMSKTDDGNVTLKINRELAREYYRALMLLKEELSITGDIGIGFLAQQREIFSVEEPEIDTATFYRAFELALDELKKVRLEEGKNLADDIAQRIRSLSAFIADLENQRTALVETARETLEEKLKALLGDTPIDETRIVQESAFLIEKSDITEEIVRIKSHLKLAQSVLDSGGVVGKKLDFLTQELYRELNTIGAKAANAGISALVVEMKHEIEKIREQAQNIQ